MTQFPPNPVSSLLTIVPSASSRAAQEQLCRERNLSIVNCFGRIVNSITCVLKMCIHTENSQLYVSIVLVWQGSEVIVHQIVCLIILGQDEKFRTFWLFTYVSKDCVYV